MFENFQVNWSCSLKCTEKDTVVVSNVIVVVLTIVILVVIQGLNGLLR